MAFVSSYRLYVPPIYDPNDVTWVQNVRGWGQKDSKELVKKNQYEYPIWTIKINHLWWFSKLALYLLNKRDGASEDALFKVFQKYKDHVHLTLSSPMYIMRWVKT